MRGGYERRHWLCLLCPHDGWNRSEREHSELSICTSEPQSKQTGWEHLIQCLWLRNVGAVSPLTSLSPQAQLCKFSLLVSKRKCLVHSSASHTTRLERRFLRERINLFFSFCFNFAFCFCTQLKPVLNPSYAPNRWFWIHGQINKRGDVIVKLVSCFQDIAVCSVPHPGWQNEVGRICHTLPNRCGVINISISDFIFDDLSLVITDKKMLLTVMAVGKAEITHTESI